MPLLWPFAWQALPLNGFRIKKGEDELLSVQHEIECPCSQTAKLGETIHQLEEQLVDGHWVLAFETPEKAQAARNMVSQRAELVCSLLKGGLSPLLL